MAMSRTKSFLLHTQKNLWKRDMQHDLTVIDPGRAGRVLYPCSPVPAADVLNTPWGSGYELPWTRVAEQAALSGSSASVK